MKNTTVNWFGNALQTLSWTDASTTFDPECVAHKPKAGNICASTVALPPRSHFSPPLSLAGAASATTGVWLQGIGNGFVITVPAKSTFQTLVGGHWQRSVSDGIHC